MSVLWAACCIRAVVLPDSRTISSGAAAGINDVSRIDSSCKASGFCSLETQPSHYVGPIRSNLELKAALTALAYKNEIILTTESRTDPAAQFVSSFQKAGYGHVLVMTDSEPMCKHLATVFQKLGCGWVPFPSLYDDALSGMFQLVSQYPKLLMGARIIRHGYNVMIMDSGEAITNLQPALHIQCFLCLDK